jgi:hypothetical protein
MLPLMNDWSPMVNNCGRRRHHNHGTQKDKCRSEAWRSRQTRYAGKMNSMSSSVPPKREIGGARRRNRCPGTGFKKAVAQVIITLGYLPM